MLFVGISRQELDTYEICVWKEWKMTEHVEIPTFGHGCHLFWFAGGRVISMSLQKGLSEHSEKFLVRMPEVPAEYSNRNFATTNKVGEPTEITNCTFVTKVSEEGVF